MFNRLVTPPFPRHLLGWSSFSEDLCSTSHILALVNYSTPGCDCFVFRVLGSPATISIRFASPRGCNLFSKIEISSNFFEDNSEPLMLFWPKKDGGVIHGDIVSRILSFGRGEWGFNREPDVAYPAGVAYWV